jgi:hypothetical protein
VPSNFKCLIFWYLFLTDFVLSVANRHINDDVLASYYLHSALLRHNNFSGNLLLVRETTCYITINRLVYLEGGIDINALP